jgi:class 3 adenylate cyclase
LVTWRRTPAQAGTAQERRSQSGRAGEITTEHRLVACLYADVSGYSQLIADDVEETVRRLTAYRDMIAGVVSAHGGR